MDEQFQELFKIQRNRKKVEIGNILIAEPFLEGKYFSRSVVFVVEHDENGSIGFILNKLMDYSTSDLVTELAGMQFPVYIGGPVEQNKLYYIHRCPALEDSLHIINGIYWGGDFDALVRRMKAGEIHQNEIRFFAGYSGWGEGQLERELDENSWMIGDISQETFFHSSNDKLWEVSMNDLGGRYRIWANFPEDPIMN